MCCIYFFVTCSGTELSDGYIIMKCVKVDKAARLVLYFTYTLNCVENLDTDFRET